jgi:hypothetical protein
MSKFSYILSLEEFSHYYRHPRHDGMGDLNQLRIGAEFWHGAGAPNPKIKSLVSFNERIDLASYWEKPRG